MNYAVVLTQDDEDNWLASVPAFAGCHTWGQTRQEALANAQEAVDGCIESLRASGDPLPVESSPPEIEFVQARVQKDPRSGRPKGRPLRGTKS